MTTTQRRCETLRRDVGHRVGDGNIGLLFVQVHDYRTLLLRGPVMLLLMVMVVMACSRMKDL